MKPRGISRIEKLEQQVNELTYKKSEFVEILNELLKAQNTIDGIETNVWEQNSKVNKVLYLLSKDLLKRLKENK